MGANDLVSSLLTAQQANAVEPPTAAPTVPSTPATQAPAPEPEAESQSDASGRAASRRRASG